METDREKINRLYQSDCVANQLLAIGMLGLIGETAANFIWEDILSKIKKEEIIKKLGGGLAWANDLIFIDIPIVGGRLRVYNNILYAIAFLPNNYRVALGSWRNTEMGECYDKIIKKLKELVFECTHLFTDIEPDF